MQDALLPEKIEIAVFESVVEQGYVNGLDPIAEAGVADSLSQSTKRGPVDIDTDHLAPAETGQLHGLLPPAAADVQNPRPIERGKQPKGPPAMLQAPAAQFLYVQCSIDVDHVWETSNAAGHRVVRDTRDHHARSERKPISHMLFDG
jgi:hypothetical protein